MWKLWTEGPRRLNFEWWSPYLLLLSAGLCFGQAATPPVTPQPPVAPAPVTIPLPGVPVSIPALPAGPSNFSVVGAIGTPTSAPRHAAAAIGFSESVSTTQDFFLTVVLGPQPGSGTEQESILLGMTQQLGTVTILGIQMRSWASAAWGTALSNAAKVSLTGTPATTVASASTNAAFTSQYVFGLGYTPKWCARCEYGPAGKYVHTTGERSQAEVAFYWKWKP